MLPSTPCQPLPWLFTSLMPGQLSVHLSDHRDCECLAPMDFPHALSLALVGDDGALISGPLPRYPKCHSLQMCCTGGGA